MKNIIKEVALDLEEFLNMKSDLFVSTDEKIKIYRIAGNIIRIDIKEEV